MNDHNPKRLFYGSCFALITTAFSFSIRAGILPQLGETFDLTAQQLGDINSMFFYGFPISMLREFEASWTAPLRAEAGGSIRSAPSN